MDLRLNDIHEGVQKFIPLTYPTAIKKQIELHQNLLALIKLCQAVRKESLSLRVKKGKHPPPEDEQKYLMSE